jgi:tripartite-type tricarboxylate transporter receptor subunit TctC
LATGCRRLGQPLIVDNKAGAGGLIAGEAFAKSAPRGNPRPYPYRGGTSSFPRSRVLFVIHAAPWLLS